MYYKIERKTCFLILYFQDKNALTINLYKQNNSIAQNVSLIGENLFTLF